MDLFPDGKLQKSLLRQYLLQSRDHGRVIDDIVHPAVADDFLRSGEQWLESAILFDSGFDERIHPDHVVSVTAPIETRLERVMTRDGIDREKAMAWISRQLPQDVVRAKSDFEIVNDGIVPLSPQIDRLLEALGQPTHET